MNAPLTTARLYGIVDLGYIAPNDVCETTEKLCLGGVDVLQLRAKKHAPMDILAMAQKIRPLCRDFGVPFFINDFPEIARDVEADGIHIGQDDGNLSDVRAIVGSSMLVGRSTHSPEQARDAMKEGFDCIGFGPLFPTPTKAGRSSIGLDAIAAMQQEVGLQIPMFCIGGISLANLSEVIAAGARRVVMVSALLQAADLLGATKQAKRMLCDAV